VEKLRSEPLPYYKPKSDLLGVTPQHDLYEVIKYEAVKGFLFFVLYATHGSGEFVMDALARLEEGDLEFFGRIGLQGLTNALLQCTCPAGGETFFPISSTEITLAIGCGDTDGVTATVDELKEFYDDMAKTSEFAELWSFHAACAAWKVVGKERFKGSFKQNTSFPLLLIGNVADPVTPLWNAHKMSEGFKDSVVLTQNSSGHCSISATSICTTKAVHAYFRNGTVPEKGTFCEVESTIFAGTREIDFSAFSTEEQELFRASQDLQANYFVPRLPVMHI